MHRIRSLAADGMNMSRNEWHDEWMVLHSDRQAGSPWLKEVPGKQVRIASVQMNARKALMQPPPSAAGIALTSICTLLLTSSMNEAFP